MLKDVLLWIVMICLLPFLFVFLWALVRFPFYLARWAFHVLEEKGAEINEERFK
jgi:hypothetical protein